MLSTFGKYCSACAIITLAAFFSASNTQAQQNQALIDASIDSLHGEKAIQLQQTSIVSEVAGSMAQTTVTLIFYNPNARPLEGNLQFPLAERQQLIGFALDLGGKLRNAVPVEKAKGRQVFEEIVRRGIDPALLEMTQGNNFKLRIYPIPAYGTRTVQLRVVQNLQRNQNQWEFALPLSFAQEADKTQIKIHVRGIEKTPQVTFGTKQLVYEKTSDGYSLSYEGQNIGRQSSIVTSFPVAVTPQTFIQEFQGETYFYAEVPVKHNHKPRSLATKIGLLWDSSSSALNRKIDAEIELLDRYFKAVGNVEVQLQRLRDKAESIEVFSIKQGEWSALRKALKNTVYDGASAITDWQVDKNVQEYLLFSDGLLNYGSKQFPKLAKQQRLFTINSADSADLRRLRAIAEQNHGHLISVGTDNIDAASNSLLSEVSRVLEIQGGHLGEIEVESMIPDGEILRIAGKLSAPKANLSLTMNVNGKPQTSMLAIDAQAAPHPLAAFFWGNYRLHSLEADRDLHRAEIRRLGKKFNIPSSETSLIVLEDINDYLRYEITPPDELLVEYNKLKIDQQSSRQNKQRAQTDALVQQFQERIDWWQTDFKKILKGRKDSAPLPIEERRAEPPRPIEPIRPAAPIVMDAQRTPVLAKGNARERFSEVEAPVAHARAVTVIGSALHRTDAETANQSVPVSPSNASSRSENLTTISLKKWTSNAPYMKRLSAASKENIYAVYLDEKPSYLNSSAFFLDAADALKDKGQVALAMRVLSNLMEMDLENRHVLRLLGYRLMELGAYRQASQVFEKIVELAEEEPQSYRDLGLALGAENKYQAAIDQFQKVIEGEWQNRFGDIKMISLTEMNALIAAAKNNGQALDLSKIDPRLIRNLPLDLRVVMSWDADNADMDLWVTDPNGEAAGYSHPRTLQEGRMSRDVTQGYGPEEFALHNALPGKYQIHAQFFGNRQQIVAGATTVLVRLTAHFGTAQAKEKLISLRIKDQGGRIFVGEFEVMPDKKLE